jgi:outer membrane lipoprotein carrier protein
MQTFKKLLSSICLLLGSISIAHADSASDSLTALLKNMHSMQADFTQNIVDKRGKIIQKSTGHMDLQRPNQFRWDVQSPMKQLIITNGKRIWIYDPDLEQVTIRKLVKAAGETPAMLLSDENITLTNDFTVKQLTNSSFLLIPKDQGSIISSLKLGFNNQQIHEMQLEDHLGHLTKIEFGHVVLNKPESTSLFNFKPPAHIDIIDETKH